MEEINPYESPKAELPSDDQPDDLYTIARRASEGTPYPPEAFVFLAQAFEFAKGHIRQPPTASHHIDSETLCWCLHDFAIYRFGEEAVAQLDAWHIRSTRDFGELVFRLIALGHIRPADGETVSDFDGVFEFADQFNFQDFRSTLLLDEDD